MKSSKRDDTYEDFGKLCNQQKQQLHKFSIYTCTSLGSKELNYTLNSKPYDEPVTTVQVHIVPSPFRFNSIDMISNNKMLKLVRSYII